MTSATASEPSGTGYSSSMPAGNVAVNNYQTSDPQIFAAGDTISGPSVVARKIDSGRQAAVIDRWLKKGT